MKRLSILHKVKYKFSHYIKARPNLFGLIKISLNSFPSCCFSWFLPLSFLFLDYCSSFLTGTMPLFFPSPNLFILCQGTFLNTNPFILFPCLKFFSGSLWPTKWSSNFLSWHLIHHLVLAYIFSIISYYFLFSILYSSNTELFMVTGT